MSTDAQLLLWIIGCIFGVMFIVRASRKYRKKQAINRQSEKFGQTILEKSSVSNAASDPLFEASLPKILKSDFENSPPKKVQPEIMVLSIMPKFESTFRGDILLSTLEENQFYYDALKIFNYDLDLSPTQSVSFCLASVLKPGTFEYAQMKYQEFSGVLLWTEFSGAYHEEIFEHFMDMARKLTMTLSGELCDGQRQPLTVQTLSYYRDKIRNLQDTVNNEQKG